MTDEELLAGFENQALRAEQWNHCNHIRVAYLYVCRGTFEEALQWMSSGIRKLNPVLGIPELQRRGFHMTITMAWLWLVRSAVIRDGVCSTSREFLTRNPELLDKRLLRSFYSDSVLFSPDAKARFVSPDLISLPVQTAEDENTERTAP